MMVTVYRNNQTFGPYSLEVLKKYTEEGKILLSDRAIEQPNIEMMTVRQILKMHQIDIHIQHAGSIGSQIKTLANRLIIPDLSLLKKDKFKDKKLLYLAFVGLAPAFLIRFSFSSYFTFYAIALYFAVLWGIFFHSLFKTDQVDKRRAAFIFFLSQAMALILINIQSIPPFSIFYSFLHSESMLLKLVGFIVGVGVLEETIKAIPLYYLSKKTAEPLIPQTLVFYGLISGIGFGVFEGVLYQTTSNTELAYNEAFFMNIARLTSLPFLHAIWCGIAGYFISFSNLYPLYRKGLRFIAVFIPALLHGTYDVFGWSIIGLAITVFSVLLMLFYLKRCGDYQSKLLNI